MISRDIFGGPRLASLLRGQRSRTLWHAIDEAAGYLAGLIVLVAMFAVIIFGVPMIAGLFMGD